MKHNTSVRGFTLLEMALSISILGIIFGMVGPLYNTFMVRNDLDVTVGTMVQSMRRAGTLARALDGDSVWGVHVATGSILIFKGTSFAGRDITADENTEIPNNIVVTGLTDVVFNKKTGLPQTFGTTTFTSVTNETRNVTINEKGMVDY